MIATLYVVNSYNYISIWLSTTQFCCWEVCNIVVNLAGFAGSTGVYLQSKNPQILSWDWGQPSPHFLARRWCAYLQTCRYLSPVNSTLNNLAIWCCNQEMETSNNQGNIGWGTKRCKTYPNNHRAKAVKRKIASSHIFWNVVTNH